MCVGIVFVCTIHMLLLLLLLLLCGCSARLLYSCIAVLFLVFSRFAPCRRFSLVCSFCDWSILRPNVFVANACIPPVADRYCESIGWSLEIEGVHVVAWRVLVPSVVLVPERNSD